MNHTPSDARAERLAKALRDNLRRRKAAPEPAEPPPQPPVAAPCEADPSKP